MFLPDTRARRDGAQRTPSSSTSAAPASAIRRFSSGRRRKSEDSPRFANARQTGARGRGGRTSPPALCRDDARRRTARRRRTTKACGPSAGQLVRPRPRRSRRRLASGAGALGRRRSHLAARRGPDQRSRPGEARRSPAIAGAPMALCGGRPRAGHDAPQPLARRRGGSREPSEPHAAPGGPHRPPPAATSAGRRPPSGGAQVAERFLALQGRRADRRSAQSARRTRARDARSPGTRASVRSGLARRSGGGGRFASRRAARPARSRDGSIGSPSARTRSTSPTSRAARPPAREPAGLCRSARALPRRARSALSRPCPCARSSFGSGRAKSLKFARGARRGDDEVRPSNLTPARLPGDCGN